MKTKNAVKSRLSDFVGESVFDGLDADTVVVKVYAVGRRKPVAVIEVHHEHGVIGDGLAGDDGDLIAGCLDLGWVRGDIENRLTWKVVS